MIFINNDDVMGKNIHDLRCRQNLSLEELSKIVGMDTAALYAIENGKVWKLRDGFWKISAAFSTQI